MKETKAHVCFWAAAFGVYAVWCLAAAAGVLAGWMLDRFGADPGIFSGLVMNTGLFMAACFQMTLFWVHVNPTLTVKRWAWMLGIVSFCHIILAVVHLQAADIASGGICPGVTAAAATSNLLMLSYLLGSRLIMPVKQAQDFVKVCAVAAAADAASFLFGPTLLAADALAEYYGQGMGGPVPFVDVFLIKFPDFSGNFMPVTGAADWIVISVLSFGAMNLGINDNMAGPPFSGGSPMRRPGLYFPAAAFGGLICVLASRCLNAFLPALPLIGAVFLARIQLFPRQRRPMGVTDKLLSAGVLALAVVMVVMSLATKVHMNIFQ